MTHGFWDVHVWLSLHIIALQCAVARLHLAKNDLLLY